MKVSIAYPPLAGKGCPLLAQNRQFQWFSNACYIYPMVPAYAATLLAHNGFEATWDDYIAEKKTHAQFLSAFQRSQPDVIAIETKTPVVKQHWHVINELKQIAPKTITVLMGDHVTALPEESMRSCSVDYVITGGDYDFQLLGVCRHLRDGAALPKGIWYRENGRIKNTGPFELSHDLNALPFIDRDLTRWRLYSEQNGNYKRTPGTYTMAGRDCWWAKCTFCSWTTTYPKFRTRTPESLLDEVGMLIERYKVREIFDDTGTFPAGNWLEKFCSGMVERCYNEKIYFSCNMRAGALSKAQYELMGRAGFRMLLYGLESANQETLDRLHKGTKAGQIAADCRMAKNAGMEPHLTAMVGYPWETRDDAGQTIALAKRIFDDGFADTLQATIVIPYPGTPLFEECKKNGWLLTDDWNRYDMREPVMRTALSATEIKALTQNLYKVFTSPRYAMRKLSGMRNFEDLRFFKKGAKALVGHLRDFS